MQIKSLPNLANLRVAVHPDGTLLAKEALDFLFEQFHPLRETRTYVAHWDIAHCFVMVQMTLRRKRKVAEGRSR